MRTKIMLTAALMVWMITIASSDGIPDFPEVYAGYATISSIVAPENTSVLVEVVSTGEVVGNTTIDGNGKFTLMIRFCNSTSGENTTDGLAQIGDTLRWVVNDTITLFPRAGRDTAIPGEVNPNYLASVGYPSIRIVDHTPETQTPGVINGTDITFTATVAAPYPELIEYNWTLDGEYQSNSSSWTYTAPGNESGAKTVTLDVTDGVTEDSYTWNLTIGACSGVYPSTSGDWNITSNTSCANTNITLSGNSSVNVIGNVTLSFENVTLVLEDGELMSYDGGDSNGIIDSIVDTIIDWIT